MIWAASISRLFHTFESEKDINFPDFSVKCILIFHKFFFSIQLFLSIVSHFDKQKLKKYYDFVKEKLGKITTTLLSISLLRLRAVGMATKTPHPFSSPPVVSYISIDQNCQDIMKIYFALEYK